MPKFSTVILFDSSHAETLKYNDKIFMFFIISNYLLNYTEITFQGAQ